MYEQVEKPKDNKSRAVANSVTQKQSSRKQGFEFMDNRPEKIAQRKIKEMTDNCSIQQQKSFQKKESQTSLPYTLKSGIENSPKQMLPWPAKVKKRPNVAATNWAEEDVEDVQELYEWCATKEHFQKIIGVMTQSEWFASKDFITEALRVEFDSGLNDASSQSEIASLFAYFKSRASAPRVLQAYDPSSYVFPSPHAVQVMTAAGIVPVDYVRPGLHASIGGVRLADVNHETLVWEKETNKGVLKMPERIQKNQEIATACVELQDKVNELAIDKTTLDKEEAAITLHNTNVAAMGVLANTIPSFVGVIGNPLANMIWTTSVNNAGKTGYLEESNTIHPKATLTAATALLRIFSFAWREAYPNGTQYLSNPHTPGGGNPEDKSDHSNPELRTSIYQADFIVDWGGKTTVVHINSASA